MRATTTQYRESDAAFVSRLLGEEGWSWRLEHSDDERPLSQARSARHCLVIHDASGQRPDLGALRFGRPDLRGSVLGLPEDTLTAIALQRQAGPNTVSLGAWDPRQLAGVTAQATSSLEAGALPPLEVYQGHGQQAFAEFRDGELHAHTPAAEAQAALALARHELAYKTLHGQGGVRRLAPGADFTLTEHSRYPLGGDEARFVVLSVAHEAANNLGSEAAQLLKRPELEAGSYRNDFQAAPAAARLVPPQRPKPQAPGVQTALVVGHPSDTLTTERDLRVRVQFPWQRGQAPLPGGLSGPTTPGQAESGHAPGDAAASQWVRVAQPSAGANWGAVFLPRVGTEVLVDFVEGDLDRPLIVGQLYNGQDALPWPAGVDSGANHPGTLSGWHSRTLDDDGGNQWVIDDATGQLRMRLASHSAGSPWSELSLGHIISQGYASAQRGAWLGSGFYAHTDGWASLRAGQGLLLSSTARRGSYGSAQGGQLDVQEAVAQLKGAQQLGQALSEAAKAQGALALTSHEAQAQAALQGLLEAIDVQKDGKHASEQQGASREASEPVAQFARPFVVFDTPSAAITASPASIASYSGQDTTLVAQGDLHAAVAHTASLVSGEATSLYTHEGSCRRSPPTAGSRCGRTPMRWSFLADQDITVISVNDEITITAKERIEIVGGDSKVVLDGANIEFATPGSFTVKAASHSWAGGGKGNASLSSLPTGLQPSDGPFIGQYVLNKTDERPFEGYRYRIVDGERVLLEGKTSPTGQTGLVSTDRAKYIEVHKTIMRDDQKITENWAGYINGTLEGTTPPKRNPIPDDYLAPNEEET
ncbi:type VI secretion system tip protein VgrG [Rhizobacter sp. J219]|uniref:type VI secretion system Vgr family protein n=1 Tax=Rhizobacter sp. J219 TaxID=2898430 RepID=UPI002151B0EB|nr:type VI secretion system tip protein VgrG [Rhizobacter sp. J219]MCR5885989.1 type VI secretion system tip protein VgrG [Rhizobacter sp. J219]